MNRWKNDPIFKANRKQLSRLRADNVELSLLRAGEKPGGKHAAGEPCTIDFTLQELVEHFHIPEVPDVAKTNPAGYQANPALLKEIESLCP
jgi:hypothetical protein